MSKPEDGASKGIDVDKVVSRLLDIIQQQQSELAKHRVYLEQVVPMFTAVPKAEEKPEVVQVSEFENFEEQSQFEPSYLTERSNISKTFKENWLFLAIVALAFVGTAIFAFKPRIPEMERLRAQVAKTEVALQDMTSEKQRLINEHNIEVIDLQKRLKDTEEALSQNESALLDEQNTVRKLSQAPQTQSLTPVETTTAVGVDRASQARSESERIRIDLDNARSAVVAARQAYVDNERVLAQNRLALDTVEREKKALQSPTEYKDVPAKQWLDFVDADALPLIQSKPEELPKYQLDAKIKASDSIDSEKFEKAEIALLTTCQTDLREFQNRIVEKEQAISALESKLKVEEAELLELQKAKREPPFNNGNHAAQTAVLNQSTAPSGTH